MIHEFEMTKELVASKMDGFRKYEVRQAKTVSVGDFVEYKEKESNVVHVFEAKEIKPFNGDNRLEVVYESYLGTVD